MKLLRCLVFFASTGFSIAGASPAWVKTAIASAKISNVQDAPAVVLLDETTMDVNARGVATIVQRKVVKILTSHGSNFATGWVAYNEVTDHIKSTSAWIVRGGEDFKTAKKNDWVDQTKNGARTLCGDIRYKSLDFETSTVTGDVFAFESVVEGPLFEAQLTLRLDNTLPAVAKSFRVTVAPGFKVDYIAHAVESADLPVVSDNGQTLIWSVHDRPMWPDEPSAPDPLRIAPAIGVRIAPLAQGEGFSPAVFKSWSEVGTWHEKLQAGQCDGDDALVAKAHQLTANAPDTLSKIRALGVFVQQLRYVASDKDLGKGDGYKPRKATLVLQRAYGDCKDKSNLLRAMLREVGITSFLACARATEDFDVWSDFPCLDMFNHAILGIVVGDDVKLPSVVVAGGQRMLFFDPTDPHTVLGDLPGALQGSSIGVMASTCNELVVLPTISGPQSCAMHRCVTLRLLPSGAVAGHAKISASGQVGAALRAGLFYATTKNDLTALTLAQLSDALRAAHLETPKVQDDRESGLCTIEFDFSANDFLQRMPGAMAVARLDLLTRKGVPTLSAKTRKSPVLLRPLVFEDEITLELPESMAVDDLPAKLSKSTAFGSYDRICEQQGNLVRLKRHAELRGATIAAADYVGLRQFLTDYAKADRATLLLKMVAAAPAQVAPAATTAAVSVN